MGPVLGIDFGTTNSVLCIYNQGIPKEFSYIVQRKESNLIPSTVAIDDKHNFYFGFDALEKNQDNYWVIKSIKRYLSDQEKRDAPIEIFGIKYTPAEIIYKMFEYFASLVQAQFNLDAKECSIPCVVTVPAHFCDRSRSIIKSAAIKAGWNVMRIINEPTAAALSYGLNTDASGVYAIYDFGGGTFDVSILRLRSGFFQVIATGGDALLGGDDIDMAMLKAIKSDFSVASKMSNKELQNLATTIKHFFGQELKIANNKIWKDDNISISYEYFCNVASPIIQKTLSIFQNVVSEAKLDSIQLSGIVLVGGSTRFPLVLDKIREQFPNVPLFCDHNPDLIVAHGASIKAFDLHTQTNSGLLIDVAPLSLGLEVMGGVVEVLIPRNTPIPFTAHREFTTFQDGQYGMDIHVVQGERALVKDCISLGKFTLSGIPPMRAGLPRINVSFSIDANGILKITAIEGTNKLSQMITLDTQENLDPEMIEGILLAAKENMMQDQKNKNLIFTQNQWTRLVLQANKILIDPSITEERKMEIRRTIELIDPKQESNAMQISSATIALAEIIGPIVSQKLIQIAQDGLVGKRPEDL